MELYAGLDLHSRNTYIGVMDKAFNRVTSGTPLSRISHEEFILVLKTKKKRPKIKRLY